MRDVTRTARRGWRQQICRVRYVAAVAAPLPQAQLYRMVILMCDPQVYASQTVERARCQRLPYRQDFTRAPPDAALRRKRVCHRALMSLRAMFMRADDATVVRRCRR